MYEPGKWQMQRVLLSPARVEAGEKMWRKSLTYLLPSLLKMYILIAETAQVWKGQNMRLKKLCGKMWFAWEEEEQSWELNLELEQELQKEFWRATGVGRGDQGARGVGKKRR